jgi:hypothetical protein
MKKFLMILPLLWLFLGCSTLRVTVDYDPEFEFEKQKSVAVVHYDREGENTLLNDRLIAALQKELSAKGYRQSSKEEAELLFVFHVNVEEKVDIDTDYHMAGFFGYGYSPGMIATTRTYRYTKGTLIIDALNPKNKKIVWRSIATDTLSRKETPQERIEYVNTVIAEAMKSYPPAQKR